MTEFSERPRRFRSSKNSVRVSKRQRHDARKSCRDLVVLNSDGQICRRTTRGISNLASFGYFKLLFSITQKFRIHKFLIIGSCPQVSTVAHHLDSDFRRKKILIARNSCVLQQTKNSFDNPEKKKIKIKIKTRMKYFGNRNVAL